MDIESKMSNLKNEEKKLARAYFKKVEENGDDLFEKDPSVVEKVVKLSPEKSLPVLIEGLNILETGRHEPCTVFATILKIGKKNRKITVKYLQDALTSQTAPNYYLTELVQKLEK